MRLLPLVCLLGLATLGCSGATPPTEAPAPAAPVAPTAPAAPVAPPPAPAATPMPTDMPFYFNRPITQADVEGKGLRELTLMRNTIYARAGNPFRKRWLDTWFRAQPWYQPKPQMDESLLSEVDRTNAAFVARYEASLTRVTLAIRMNDLMQRLKDQKDLPDADLIELVLLARATGEDLAQWEESWEVKLPPRTHSLVDVTPLDDPKMLDRQLVVEELRDLSKRDLRILRNMVYARHGRPFKSPTLQQYFSRFEWYTEDPAFSESRLSELDRRNVKLIQSVEDSIGGAMTEHEQQTAESWFDGA